MKDFLIRLLVWSAAFFGFFKIADVLIRLLDAYTRFNALQVVVVIGALSFCLIAVIFANKVEDWLLDDRL